MTFSCSSSMTPSLLLLHQFILRALCGKPHLDMEDAEINDIQSLLSNWGLMEKDIGHVKGKNSPTPFTHQLMENSFFFPSKVFFQKL